MAAKIQPWKTLFLFVLSFISSIPLFSCQANSPQNIQTFYPFPLPPIFSAPNSTNNNQPISPSPPSPPRQPLSSPPSKPSSKKAVVKAVIATAASTIVLSGLFFLLLQRHSRRKRQKNIATSNHGNPAVPPPEFTRFNGNVKGVIVDEEGLDVFYWRKLEGGNVRSSFKKEIFRVNRDGEEEEGRKRENFESPVQEIPLLRGKSSTSQSQLWGEVEDGDRKKAPKVPPVGVSFKSLEKQESLVQQSTLSPTLPTPPPPPPPPLVPVKKISHAPPPPPPKIGGMASSSKPPPIMPSSSKQNQSSSEDGNQVKLKPLHWDKVNPSNADHSMVWDKIERGSFRFDGDLMEALFGSVATTRKSPRESNSTSPIGEKSGPPSQIFILDTRKSQNTAIVLRSLAVTRKEIIGALIEGQGLNADTLEKLTKVAPTKEEESEILAFDGDSTKLADAESFLFHLLKAVPSAFTRFDAMLFRSNYDAEILHLKDSLQTIELGCDELRTRGLFLKLLEAILKAGNRMNAGTSRGNAQAFNLTSLRKLSDVKSTDGKTTLLHFVVEEVVRAEGKRNVISRNRSLGRSSSSRSSNSGNFTSDTNTSKDEREKEYIRLGLPVVGGISSEFSNVKKAASLDYDALNKSCSGLAERIREIRQHVETNGGGGGFVRHIKGFLDAAEEEIRVVREEQTRVMGLVKRTTEYYHAGASKDNGEHPLQLFVIVKDFLGMVDQVCVEIAKDLQKRRTASAGGGSSLPSSSNPPAPRSVKFPLLSANFMSEKSQKSNSSDSDDDV
ncbi:hypothetical protein RJ640_029496 [Escallonia rubra]|uniref:Formin-like protein n=1 Tax=Escallonia rubra TaxID=112253 RepID=A0AA88UTV4_9ASTE|nr:hypothetical protein RJ640_029496 [Escallonia rubra]